MGKPYSIDLRERVHADIENGQSRRAAARRYEVSASFAVKLAERVSLTGSAEPARQGRPPGGGKLAPYLRALIGWVEAEPDVTMPEAGGQVKSREGCDGASGFVVAGTSEGGLFLQKKHFWPRRAHQYDEARQAREEWKTHRQPHMLERVHRLVFLDETGTTTKDAPPARTGSPRCPFEGRCAVRPLGDTDLHRWITMRWSDRAVGGRPTL